MNRLSDAIFMAAIIALQALGAGQYMNVWDDDGYLISKIQDITDQIPEIMLPEDAPSVLTAEWKMLPDVAQYGAADWSSAVGIAHGVTAAEAIAIAESNPDISFFFFLKGCRMVLVDAEASPPYARIFKHGDAVFFTGDAAEMAIWGTATGYADGYVRQ